MFLIDPEIWAVLTIIQEASGENSEGMIAVGEVIRKRMRLKLFSDGTVPGTVLRPYQFSGWNTTDPNRIRVSLSKINDPIVVKAITAWENSRVTSHSNGATHYHSRKIKSPDWAAGKTSCASIGNHIFYDLSLITKI